MKKINITILTNPLLFNTNRIEFLIKNIQRSSLSLNRKDYKIDLKFLLWQPIYFSHFLTHISENSLNEYNFEKYSEFEDAFDIVNKNGFENDKLSHILNKIIKNNDKLLVDFNKIYFEFANKHQLGYSATQQYMILTDDIRNSFEYDMYFFISSNFLTSDDSITHWIVNYEKYPELPFYLDWPSWEKKEIQPNTFRMGWVNNTHAFSLRPQKLITWLDKTLFDDDFLEIKFNEYHGDYGIFQDGYEKSDKLHLGLHWLSENISEVLIKNGKGVLKKDDFHIIDPKCFNDGFPLHIAKDSVEPGVAWNLFFDLYMVKYGAQKFNIDIKSFANIKIPSSSLSGTLDYGELFILHENDIIFLKLISLIDDVMYTGLTDEDKVKLFFESSLNIFKNYTDFDGYWELQKNDSYEEKKVIRDNIYKETVLKYTGGKYEYRNK